eukprot:6487093-Amphidinium_carterae.4
MHSDSHALQQRLGMLRTLLNGHKLVFLQEIHDTCGLDEFAGELFWVSWTRHPSAPRAGGVATFVHKHLTSDAPDFVVVVEGRVLAAHFWLGSLPICFVNCHITPDDALQLSWVRMSEAVRDYVRTINEGLVILIGDMNFADLPSDVVDFSGHEVRFADVRANCWERCFPDFSHICSSWTLRHKATGTLRRNDRCYVRLSPLLLHLFGMCSQVIGSPVLPPAGSDHWPLSIYWAHAGDGHDGPILSRAICAHPEWGRCFRHYLLDFDLLDGSVAQRWGRVLAAARLAATALHHSSGPVVLGSQRSQYEFAMKCMRMLVEGRVRRARSLLQRSIWADLAIFDDTRLLVELETKAQSAWEALLREDIVFNERDGGDKNTASFLIRLLALWKRRRVGSASPHISTDGNMHPNVSDEVRALKTYWSSVFDRDFTPCPDAVSVLSPWVQSLAWPIADITVQDVCDCISLLPDTAGGPDGLCYRMLRYVGPLVAPILKDAASSILEGGLFPPSWNDAFLVFIPKGSVTHVGPEGVRPLCLVNIARKILCKVWAYKLRVLLSELHPSQVGFMPGRHACEALARLEKHAFVEAATNKHCALFFSDLRQAFASMSRRWIFHVLAQSGASEAWIRVFSAVLDYSCLFLLWKGTMHDAIWMRSGVGQGDPLSPFLFVLALDPFLRWMHDGRIPSSVGAALADDMCWLLRSLADLIRKHDEYRILYLATGLPLNYAKCDVLPCGALGVNAWSALLHDAVPPQHPLLFVGIVHELRYLGFWLSRGPIAALDTLAARKVSTSATLIRGMHIGVVRNVQLAHIVLEGMLRFPLMATSVSHVARTAWRDVERVLSLSSLNLGAVSYWVKDLFSWPRNGTSLDHLSLVAKLPLLLGPASDCSEVWHNIVSRCPQGMLTHPLSGWMVNSCWHSWHCARVQLHDLGVLSSVGTLRMTLPAASGIIRLACIPTLPQTLRVWIALLHRKWHAHLPQSRLGARFLDRACSAVKFVTQFHSPAASAALVRLLLGSHEVHAKHCHTGNCCFCAKFHIASSWAHRLLCGCFRLALAPIPVFSWLATADAHIFLQLVVNSSDKVIAHRLGSLALALAEAVNSCQHSAIADADDIRPFALQCALRARRRRAGRASTR